MLLAPIAQAPPRTFLALPLGHALPGLDWVRLTATPAEAASTTAGDSLDSVAVFLSLGLFTTAGFMMKEDV